MQAIESGTIMYKVKNNLKETSIKFENQIIFCAKCLHLETQELKASFTFVPSDNYFEEGSRYRTTSRIEISENGYNLLPKIALYQPTSVNKVVGYGGIDREYDNVPVSLLNTRAFDIMIKEWLMAIPYEVKRFSLHQIRTTDCGNPTPEGTHRDGTDWTGVYIVNRHNIENNSGASQYWGNDGEQLLDQVFNEATLIVHCDRFFTHCATPIKKSCQDEPSYRDVFVITSPEHGVNHEGKYQEGISESRP